MAKPALAPTISNTEIARRRSQRLLSLTETAARYRCHIVTIWRRLRDDPDFPRPIRLSANRIAFYEDEIDAHIESRPRVATSKKGGAR